MTKNNVEKVQVKWYNTKKFRVTLAVTIGVVVGAVIFRIGLDEEPIVDTYEPIPPEQLERELLELLEFEKMEEDEETRLSEYK